MNRHSCINTISVAGYRTSMYQHAAEHGIIEHGLIQISENYDDGTRESIWVETAVSCIQWGVGPWLYHTPSPAIDGRRVGPLSRRGTLVFDAWIKTVVSMLVTMTFLVFLVVGMGRFPVLIALSCVVFLSAVAACWYASRTYYYWTIYTNARGRCWRGLYDKMRTIHPARDNAAQFASVRLWLTGQMSETNRGEYATDL